MNSNILFIYLVISSWMTSVGQSVTFEKTYPINSAAQVIQESDDGYILSGSGYLNFTKVDLSGYIMWTKSYPDILTTGNNVTKTFDGGYIAIGTRFSDDSTRICIIKLNQDMDTVWTKTYTGLINTWKVYSIIQMTDNTYIFSTREYSRPYLRKIAADGTLIWTKEVSGTNTLLGNYLVKLSDGNFLLACRTSVIKFNQEAEILWQKNFNLQPYCTQVSDGHILLSTTSYSQKIDLTGNIIWQKPLPTFVSAIQSFENEYILLNTPVSTSFSTSNIIRIDTAGNLISTTNLTEHGIQIIKTNDDGFAICGNIDQVFNINNKTTWLLKIDHNLNYTSVNFREPIDGSTLNMFNLYPIVWKVNNVNYVNIEYSIDDQITWNEIINYYPAQSDTFEWTLPSLPSGNLYLKISDSFNPDIYDRSDPPQIITNQTHYSYIAANEIFMWVGNNGMNSHDPRTDGSGFYWPGGEDATISAIFADGLVWGGKVNGEIRVNGSTYRYGLTPGYILPSGLPSDPTEIEARIFKLKKDWQMLPVGPERDRYEFNYLNWPVDVGAPWTDNNNDGIYTLGIDEPKIIGDETLFFVANDLDTARSLYTYGSNPIGLELQVTTFGYNTELLKDVVFKKFRVINKSSADVTDMYFTYWADDDLGDASDDYVGFDSTLNLAYCFNADNDDNFFYETPPPALAHMIVQGPTVPSAQSDSARFGDGWKKGYKNLNISSSGLNFKGTMIGYPSDPQLGIYEGTLEFYNMMQGLNSDGNSIINPISGEPTIWPLCGDPVAGTGWFEGEGWPGGPSPSDRRYHVPTGSFNLAVGDTQEVAIAILIKKGTDNINSITELKNYAAQIQHWYDNDFVTDLNENKLLLPVEFSLSQNYPNPFNPSTTISYQLPVTSKVTLKIYDILGSEVATLVNQEQSVGNYKVDFNASQLSSGVYFYQLNAGDFIQSKKMILIK